MKKSPRSVFFTLFAFIFIDLALVALFSVIGIIYLILGSPTIKNKNNKLVILIHGTGASHWQWAVAKVYLYVKGIEFMSVSYNSDQEIIKSCEDVINYISLFKENKDIILIGHSQGGLIARSIHHKIQSKMTFLINTPQKGAIIINWLFPNKLEENNSLNDMRCDSDFINNLSSLKDSDNIYEIVGLNDFIRPEHCICLGKNIYFSWFGHYFSAVNPILWFNYIIPNINNL
jgi:hypothetical protein